MTLWHVAETLSPGQHSLVWTRGRRADWQSTSAIFRHTGVDPDCHIQRARQTGQDSDSIVPGRNGDRWRVITIPSIGPEGDVHAVSLHVAAPDVDPGPAPQVGAITLESTTVTQAAQSLLLTSADIGLEGQALDTAAFLRSVFSFDEVAEFADHCLAPMRRPAFRGVMGVKHDDGRVLKLQVVSRFDPARGSMRGITQDLTDHEPWELNLVALLKSSPIGSGRSATVLLGFPSDDHAAPVLSYWITPRPADLYDDSNTGINAIHPEDIDTLRRVRQLLAGAPTDTASLVAQVRIRGRDGWVPCSLRCTRWPGQEISSSILMCQLTLI